MFQTWSLVVRLRHANPQMRTMQLSCNLLEDWCWGPVHGCGLPTSCSCVNSCHVCGFVFVRSLFVIYLQLGSVIDVKLLWLFLRSPQPWLCGRCLRAMISRYSWEFKQGLSCTWLIPTSNIISLYQMNSVSAVFCRSCYRAKTSQHCYRPIFSLPLTSELLKSTVRTQAEMQ